ncbi:MAG: ABC transporter ATP-binding protein [Desulfobacterales bacterium]|nr:ABC transporter ATP-binding protein [Desulfobacterales bacterium]
MIQVNDLVYEYPTTCALNGVSFTIKNGSITALVGPNGAGKSTLLKCLAALISPFSGSIRINKLDILQFPRECHRIVGYLPDFFGLYDSLNIKQSMTYFALAHRVPDDLIPKRIIELVESLHLSHKLYDKVGSLSRGLRQRVAIAQAMIHNPDVLLLDEPASGLDPEARISLGQLFKELNAAGKTLIVSSHILAELNEYATDLLILKNGKILEHDVSLESQVSQKKILCLKLFHTPEDLKKILESITGIHEILEIKNNLITFTYMDSEQKQHELLLEVLKLGLQVIEFFEKRQGVQEQYLHRIQ